MKKQLAGMSVTVFSSVLVFTFTVMVLSTIVPMDKETAALHIIAGFVLFVFIVPFYFLYRHRLSSFNSSSRYWILAGIGSMAGALIYPGAYLFDKITKTSLMWRGLDPALQLGLGLVSVTLVSAMLPFAFLKIIGHCKKK